jgi:hypothetical protein
MTSKNGKNVESPSEFLLTPGVDGNIQRWKVLTHESASELFPFQADVIKTNVEFVPPPVVEEDYTPPVGKYWLLLSWARVNMMFAVLSLTKQTLSDEQLLDTHTHVIYCS